jgi:hypothetical protein
VNQETNLPPQLQLSVATPPGWWDLPLDPATRGGEIRQLVARRMSEAASAEQEDMADLLDKAAAAAHAAGAVLASQFAVVDGDVSVAASMAVSVRSLAAGAGGPRPAEGMLSERDVAVDTVGMGPSGAARRRRCLRSLDLGQRGVLEVLSVDYSFPVPGWAVEVVATFSSPTVEASSDLVKLFDVVAATLTFQVETPGDRTE